MVDFSLPSSLGRQGKLSIFIAIVKMEILGALLAIIIGFAIFAVVWDVFIIIVAISIMIIPIIIGLILCVFIWSSGHDNIAVVVLLACFFLEYPWINVAKDNKMLDKLGKFFIPLG